MGELPVKYDLRSKQFTETTGAVRHQPNHWYDLGMRLNNNNLSSLINNQIVPVFTQEAKQIFALCYSCKFDCGIICVYSVGIPLCTLAVS